MKLGEKQVLTVVKIVDFGVYLGNDEERVLLPKKQVPQGIEVGDPIEVFLYKDSSDRMIATTNEPKLTIGKTAVLEVTDDLYPGTGNGRFRRSGHSFFLCSFPAKGTYGSEKGREISVKRSALRSDAGIL